MHFFYLLSFAVVASYAAAFPQPAGLSEQYLNSVDVDLVSGLEARSYQPVSNSHKDSDTLVLLKRQANSGGSSGGRIVFGTAPISYLSVKEADKLIDSVFKPGAFSFANISSTIDNVGDGNAEISENGEKVVTRIVGPAGGLLAKYLRRSTYVNLALTLLTGGGLRAMIDAIVSVTPPAEVSKAVLDFSRETMESITGADTKEAESDDLIANILKDTGAVRQKVEAAIKLLVETVVILLKPFNTLEALISKSEKAKVLYDQISTMMNSLTKFTEEQKKIYDELMQALGNEFF
ncbi:hypothetical protein BASA60_002586 [Batrachochytrium salamandrivorans]|nr:hypothetical protein BASA60_002586 [Batrachochytrium salamandrivorans]KAH9268186.1 hypothetical protein BASA84_000381 [Batrachochytrium salamandrivorans]